MTNDKPPTLRERVLARLDICRSTTEFDMLWDAISDEFDKPGDAVPVIPEAVRDALESEYEHRSDGNATVVLDWLRGVTRKQPVDEVPLRKACQSLFDYEAGTNGAMQEGSFLLVPNGIVVAIRKALAQPAAVVDEAPLLAELKAWLADATPFGAIWLVNKLKKLIAAAEARQPAAPFDIYEDRGERPAAPKEGT